ncbi:hypothetical protein Q9L58_010527 [Maublancomyces gigas]|uniref:Uncharacterized protein n=1 Tax=Discina gigas TaxID=1032678 RepID=A0ABR3G4V4_9PEZI
MAALPLFIFAVAGYTIRAAYAWEDRSSGQISDVPVRYNRVSWSSLPLLPRIEAVLTWDWYRGKQL